MLEREDIRDSTLDDLLQQEWVPITAAGTEQLVIENDAARQTQAAQPTGSTPADETTPSNEDRARLIELLSEERTRWLLIQEQARQLMVNGPWQIMERHQAFIEGAHNLVPTELARDYILRGFKIIEEEEAEEEEEEEQAEEEEEQAEAQGAQD